MVLSTVAEGAERCMCTDVEYEDAHTRAAMSRRADASHAEERCIQPLIQH